MKILRFCSIALFAVALGFVYTSCGDDEKDPTPEEVVEALKDVVGIEDASYVAGKMPQVTDTQTQVTASSNSSALAGGANIVTISSPVELKKIFIGVEGLDGYYEIVPTAVRSTRADSEYTYIFTMNYSTNLDENLTIVITAQTIDDLVVAVAKQVVEYVESKAGTLAINLVFDQAKDVDLHLFLPETAPITWIYYGNRGMYTGTAEEYAKLEEKEAAIWAEMLKKYGYPEDTDDEDIEDDNFWLEYYQKMESINEEYNKKYSGLDHDSNAGCSIDNLNNENIVLNAEILVPGTYKVYVNLWENCEYTEAPTQWTCITRLLNKEVTAVEGKNPAYGTFAGDANSNPDDVVERMTLATTFTLTQADIDRAKAATRAAVTPKVWNAPMGLKSIMKTMDGGTWDNVKHHRIIK